MNCHYIWQLYAISIDGLLENIMKEEEPQSVKPLQINLKVFNTNRERKSQRESLQGYTRTQTSTYNIDTQMDRLITQYGGTKTKPYLTLHQFRELAQDLYQTLDSDRILTDRQIDNVVKLVDTNGNGQISKDELIRMTMSNQVKDSIVYEKK